MPMIINPYVFAAAAAAMPTYGSEGSGATGIAISSINVPYPSSIVAGDKFVMHIVVRGLTTDGISVTAPTGWTVSNDTTVTISGTDNRAYVIIKDTGATGSETGNLAVTVNSTGRCHARMFCFTGATAFEGAASTGTGGAGSTTLNAQAITTTGANRLCLHFTSVANTSTIGGITGETGGDWTEAVAEYSVSNGMMQLQTAGLAAAGTITGGTATLGTSSTFRIRQAVALYG